MATGTEIETLTGELARETPKRDRQKVRDSWNSWGTAMANLEANKTLLDTIVADAATAEQDEYQLQQVQADWGSNLATVVGNGFSYGGKTGIPAFAQLIADTSEQAGLEGGASELRLHVGGNLVSVDQDA